LATIERKYLPPPNAKVAMAMVVALLLCLTQVSNARADSPSCLAKAASFVTELDELLLKEKNWITPYEDLNERYFPLRDCEADALLDVIRGSRFIRSISYHSRTNQYFIAFSSDDVRLNFSYLVSEKKSQMASTGFTHKW
jgi:hypothetical protein